MSDKDLFENECKNTFELLNVVKSNFSEFGKSRELSLAITKLDESRLWFQEHLHQIKIEKEG